LQQFEDVEKVVEEEEEEEIFISIEKRESHKI